ncbi:MAG TPA: PBSX family phage terminase large subunit [Candidatus Avidesulfovibrio excrementigallinarum]|nr:PBSX family phage terminase large subunit [Candidatus Avidesulfovibrio excrementigallinarum]
MIEAQLPDAFRELFRPHRYKVFYGGRGGAKSQSFAIALLMLGRQRKIRVLCAREIQKSIDESVKQLLEDEIDRLGLRGFYTSTKMEIRGANGTTFIFSGLRINVESLKSFKGVTHCWIEEAETVSERSLDIIGPTIREEGSEIWISFNPDRIHAPVWQRFVVNTPPTGSYVRKVGWQDNPWFPAVLNQERLDCLRADPAKYDWIWEGNPRLVAEGSYYGKLLQAADSEGRIGRVPVEPNLLVHTAWDLGVSDSTAIWFFQYLPAGRFGEWRFVDYYEASGEGLAHYAAVLAQKGYRYGQHIGPHDLAVRELGSGKSRIETARGLGLNFTIARNLPVVDGIEAARQVLAAAWFDKQACGKGLACLWGYQREYDDARSCFKTSPLHDWTSHGADAFRYAATGFATPAAARFDPLPARKPLRVC